MSSAPYFFPTHFRPVGHGWSTIFAAWLPAALFLCVIAMESTAYFGADHTSGPLRLVMHCVVGGTAGRNWALLHHLIRKTGHFVGYGLLAAFLLRGLRGTSAGRLARSGPLQQLTAVAGTFLVAGMDEWHQSFLPNRTGKFSDVLLDTAGAASMLILLQLLRFAARACIAAYRSKPIAEPAADYPHSVPLAA